MATVLIGILSMIVLGLPATLAIDRRARGPLLLGLAFLYGSGMIFLVLLGLSTAHLTWSMVSVTVTALVAWIALWFVRPSPPLRGPSPRVRGEGAEGSRLLREPSPRVRGEGGSKSRVRGHWLDLLFALPSLAQDVVTFFTLIGYALFATLAPLWEWDFWAIWGLKARVFLEHGGIDWRFLESPWNTFAHADYPLLLPLNYDFVSLLGGSWSDRWLGLLFVAWAVATLLIVRDLAAQESPPLVAALVTLAATSIVASRYIGLAEGPLIAFGSAGILLIRRGLLFEDGAAWRHGAILLGFAANVKNEGIALLIAIAVAVGLLRWRSIWRLWPAAALIVPWLLLRAAHVLPTDIVAGPLSARIWARLPYTAVMLQFLWSRLYQPWFWVMLIAGIMVAPAAARRREAFILLVTAIQLAFFMVSYLATPHDPRWHIATSWPRLTAQIALPITYAVVMMLAVSLPGGQESPNAEARPVL